MPMDWLQAVTFETWEHSIGLELASLFAGFSVLIGSELFITDAGERYLASQETLADHCHHEDTEADQCPMLMTAH
jgi:hypothetical protein